MVDVPARHCSNQLSIPIELPEERHRDSHQASSIFDRRLIRSDVCRFWIVVSRIVSQESHSSPHMDGRNEWFSLCTSNGTGTAMRCRAAAVERLDLGCQ